MEIERLEFKGYVEINFCLDKDKRRGIGLWTGSVFRGTRRFTGGILVFEIEY